MSKPAFASRYAARAAVLSAVAVSFGGCGGSAPTPGASHSELLVFTSTADCLATKKMSPTQCGEAIQSATQQHLAASPVYRSLVLCEKTEMEGKCERMDEKTFRPKLVAMAVDTAAIPQPMPVEAGTAPVPMPPVVAAPLYPTLAGEKGFRKLDKSIVLIDGEQVVAFSPQAVAAAELTSAVTTPQ
jgi:Protein of unknown function (DUF1190)